jgi:hypothetical protein
MHHPIQPLIIDHKGVTRFKKNEIVDYLLDHGIITLNDLAVIEFRNEDRQQFAQLIGYSLSGYSELPYVDDDAYGTAEKMAEGDLSEDKARIAYLEGELYALRAALRKPMARLFGVHPDDLTKAGEASEPSNDGN